MTFAFAALAAILAQAADGGPTPLEAAQAAFSQADFDACLHALDEASANPNPDDAELARQFLMRGRCEEALQHAPQVEQAFTHALEHDPEAQLDPQRVPPNLVGLLDTLRGRLRGTLEISTQPPGAEIAVDGQALGPAPLRRQLPMGRHRVRARSADGKVGADDEAALRANQTTRLVMALGPLAPPPAAAPAELPIALALDATFGLDPFNGFELGAGPNFSGAHWFVAFHGLVGVNGAADLEFGLRWPALYGPLGAYGLLKASACFPAGGAVAAGGGGGGVWIAATGRLDVFVQGTALAYSGTSNATSPWSFNAGVRLRLY